MRRGRLRFGRARIFSRHGERALPLVRAIRKEGAAFFNLPDMDFGANEAAFVPFFVGAVSVSLIVTPMFNAARGSILLPLLVHFQLNNPVWPDAQPHDTWFFAGAALVTLWACRRTMFRRTGAVTDVVPAGYAPA